MGCRRILCCLGRQQSLELLARLVETAPPAEMP